MIRALTRSRSSGSMVAALRPMYLAILVGCVGCVWILSQEADQVPFDERVHLGLDQVQELGIHIVHKARGEIFSTRDQSCTSPLCWGPTRPRNVLARSFPLQPQTGRSIGSFSGYHAATAGLEKPDSIVTSSPKRARVDRLVSGCALGAQRLWRIAKERTDNRPPDVGP